MCAKFHLDGIRFLVIFSKSCVFLQEWKEMENESARQVYASGAAVLRGQEPHDAWPRGAGALPHEPGRGAGSGARVHPAPAAAPEDPLLCLCRSTKSAL